MGQLQTLLKQKEGVAGNGKAAPAGRKAEAPRPAPEPEVGAARLVTGLVCRDVACQLGSGIPVVYEVLVEIEAGRIPHPQQVAATTFWLFDDPSAGPYRLEVGVLSPDRELLAVRNITLERPSHYQVATFAFGVLDLTVYGEYRLEVHLNGQFAGAYPFFLLPKPAEQTQEVEE